MKRILIFLVVLLPFLAKSQTVITGKYKYTDSLTFAKYKNNSTLDSVLSVDQNGRLRLSSKSPLDTTSLSNRIDARVKYTDTANMLIPYLRKLDTTGKWLSVGYLPYLVKYSDTAAFLSAYYNKTAIDARLALKLNISDTANMLSPYARTSNLPSLAPYVKYTDTASMLSSYYNKTATDAKLALKLNISDTANMLSSYYNKTATDSKLALKLNISDTANMLSPYARTLALGGYVPYIGATKDVNIGTKNYYGNAYFDGFTTVAASGTLITLTVSSTPSYLITGSGGQTIKLPDATTLPNGAVYVFNNNQSSGAINVNNNSNTLVKSVPSGGYLNLELIDNSSAAGSWDAHFQAPSNVSWSTNTFDYPGSITSATWNGNTIAINRGGTGASTSGGALTNLGAQPQLNGTGFVKASGTTISYDNSTYLTSADIAGKVNYTDTASMLSPYSRDYNTVHKAGVETIGGFKTFSNYTTFVDGADVIVGTTYGASGATGRFNGGIVASRGINFDNLRSPSIYANTQAFYINKSGLVSTLNIRNDTTSAYAQILQFNNNMATHYYYFPDATGTVALTSDIPSITGKLNISDTAAMLSGYKTYYPRAALSFTAGSGAYNNSTGVITIPTNTNQLTNGAGFISSYTETDPIVKAINGIVKSNGTTISAAVAGTDYVSPSGLTTALSSYLPLSGGTLTGALNGTSGKFSSSVVSGNTDGAYFETINTAGAYVAYMGDVAGAQGSPSTNHVDMSLQANKSMLFYTNNSSARTMIINTNSNVGINVNPYTGVGLEVQGTASTVFAFQVRASDGNNSIEVFPNASGYNRISSNYMTGAPYLPLALSAREINSDLVLWTDGNTSIGQSSNAGFKLDVNGTGRFTGQITNSLTGQSTIGLYLNSNQPSGINWYDIDDNEQYSMGIIANSGNGYWGLWSATGSSAIDRSTTTPIFKVGRTGAATFSSSVTAGAFITNAASGAAGQEGLRIINDNGYIGFFNGANSTRSGYLQGNTTDVTLTTSPSTPLILGTANTERMRIASNGIVSINGSFAQYGILNLRAHNTNNYGGFNVYANGNGSFINMTHNNSDGVITTDYSSSGSYTGIAFQTSAATRLYIASGGNISIGTTTDNGAKLQVNGTITTQGQAWKINSAFAGTPAMGGNVLSISINGTTYYIQLYTTTL